MMAVRYSHWNRVAYCIACKLEKRWHTRRVNIQPNPQTSVHESIGLVKHEPLNLVRCQTTFDQR
jgi:hypothetical protein